ncbi:flagellar basal-body rod modification protein FlgD [Altererythrobacter atlanticus]|uniref:Basal-body rod modification protein FlgD n=1 Tax=Croceibacterium atlanticum TaxID=1267766 RepID=A0A0F7KY87_9SPHN|nr:flagellar hook capping FlgD N-terminal domain-containing protein [Croceibacterium atlanticum]AKH44182.1 Basal-body rod modification protein FlgD [Croceibacterium atlanticum]MBB5732493.1 flagellar basal-body rod modification protein FlgD [Croceibacterium atlanticum]
MTAIASTSAANTAASSTTGKGFASLGSEDFLELLVVQMQQQDPFNPVDNTDMLAQMAQFSSLSATTDSSELLQEISDKLDLLVSAQAHGAANTETTEN